VGRNDGGGLSCTGVNARKKGRGWRISLSILTIIPRGEIEGHDPRTREKAVAD